MGVESDREGGGSTDSDTEGDGSTALHRDAGGPTDPDRESGGPTDRDREGGGQTNPVERTQRVHVRRLTVTDTLRWSWVVLRRRPGLVGLALAATLPSVLTTAGISRPSPSGTPEIAGWVWSVYLVQLLAVALVSGVVYLTAADAVANRSRPLSVHARSTVGSLLPLLATGVVIGVLVILSLFPAIFVAALGGSYVWVGLLVVPVYVSYRLLLALPACVIDEQDPVVSVREGWLAATGNVRKVFAVGVVYVLAVGASDVVAGRLGGQYDVVSTLVSAIVGAVALPFFGLALAHLYLEGSRNR